MKNQLRVKGYTLCSGLPDSIDIYSFNLKNKLINHFFDLVIFSIISCSLVLFKQFRHFLNSENTVVLDDYTMLHSPARCFSWRKSYFCLLPKAYIVILYFKRKFILNKRFSIFARIPPKLIRNNKSKLKNTSKINFSIPKQKITTCRSIKILINLFTLNTKKNKNLKIKKCIKR